MTFAEVWAALLLVAVSAFTTTLVRLFRTRRGDSAQRELLPATLATTLGVAWAALNLTIVVRDGDGPVAVPVVEEVGVILLVALLLGTWCYRTLRPRA